MPLSCGDIPKAFRAALQDAQRRGPGVAWGVTSHGDGWRILAQRDGAEAVRDLPACVVNNKRLAAVLAHYCEELAREVTGGQG